MCRLVNTIDGGLMKILSTKNRAAISQISSNTRMTPSRATPGRASIQRLKRWKKGGGASTRPVCVSTMWDIYRLFARASSVEVKVLRNSAMATTKAM